MKVTAKLAALLTAFLIVINCFPIVAVAEDSLHAVGSSSITGQDTLPIGISLGADEPVIFTVELIEDSENPGLYGTLNHIPTDTTSIYLQYSIGGEQFDYLYPAVWSGTDDAPEETAPLTMLLLGADEHPLTAYLNETVNSLYLHLSIFVKSEVGFIDTEVVKLSHNKTDTLPETPPPFTAQLELDDYGYYELNGRFTDFPPNVKRVRPIYSLNGTDYIAVDENGWNDWYLNNMGSEDAELLDWHENQYCALPYDEPLRGYLANKLERFYLQLEITTEDDLSYRTQTAVIERGAVQPLPSHLITRADFPFSMRAPYDYDEELPDYLYGQYQVTVREDATAEEVTALLPDMLPIEVQLLQKDGRMLVTAGKVYCPVTWKEIPPLNLKAGETQIITDIAGELMVPAGSTVVTPLGIYTVPSSITFKKRDEVRLMINAIPKEEKPDVSLTVREGSTYSDEDGMMTLAFRKKPSGATSITAYSVVDGKRTEICNLLDIKAVDHLQSALLYGYMNILKPDDAPLVDSNGDISGFSIELDITGGIFDGERVPLLRLSNDCDLPDEILEPDSSQGTPGNVGADDDDEDSSDNGGQRPELPDGGTNGGIGGGTGGETDGGTGGGTDGGTNGGIGGGTGGGTDGGNSNNGDKDDSTNTDTGTPPPNPPEEALLSAVALASPIVTAEAAEPSAVADSIDNFTTDITAQNEPLAPIQEMETTITSTGQRTPHGGNTSTARTFAIATTLMVGGGVTVAVASTAVGGSSVGWISKLVGAVKKLLLRG